MVVHSYKTVQTSTRRLDRKICRMYGAPSPAVPLPRQHAAHGTLDHSQQAHDDRRGVSHPPGVQPLPPPQAAPAALIHKVIGREILEEARLHAGALAVVAHLQPLR